MVLMDIKILEPLENLPLYIYRVTQKLPLRIFRKAPGFKKFFVVDILKTVLVVDLIF